ALILAATCGHIGIVKFLIAAPGIDINVGSPLSWAAHMGHDAVVALLLDKDGIDVNALNTDGKTPLMLAVISKHPAVVKCLIDVDGIDLYVEGTLHRNTALHYASSVEIIQLFIDAGADLNIQNRTGETMLADAAQTGNDASVALLLSEDSIDVNPTDNDDMTPLMWAAEYGYVAVVELLIAANGIDVNATDTEGKTALMTLLLDKDPTPRQGPYSSTRIASTSMRPIPKARLL
ncbi:putative ankyrin repeat protein, partial [Tolypocladium ophioglossoides CBS 100239]